MGIVIADKDNSEILTLEDIDNRFAGKYVLVDVLNRRDKFENGKLIAYVNMCDIELVELLKYRNILRNRIRTLVIGGVHKRGNLDRMNNDVREVINKYVDAVLNMEDVLEMYLFGSQAYGMTHEYSDIDLMVVIRSQSEESVIRQRIMESIQDVHDIPVDLLINKENNFKESLENWTTLQSQIKDEGILLYERR